MVQVWFKRAFSSAIRVGSTSRRGPTRWGLWVMLGGAIPWATWHVYEYFHPLPAPLNECHYPLRARWYIHQALWNSSSLPRQAYRLDQALRVILQGGYGAASPQATNLVIYLSQQYLNQESPRAEDLSASFKALVHKPHVGEGVAEERARLEMAFKVAARLIQTLSIEDQHEIAQRVITIMDKAPYYLGNWKNHPLRSTFETTLHGNK